MRRVLLFACIAVCLSATSAWATGGTLYAIDDSTNSLYSIDPNTYALTLIGSTGVGTGDFGDLAYNPNNGTAYWAPGRGNDNLYTINLQTGAATLVGSHGVDDMFAMAYDTATGKLYGQTSAGAFYDINTTNGSATLLGNNSVYAGGLEYRADTNQLILAEAGGNSSFYSVNPTNGGTTLLGTPGFLNDNDVAWDPVRGIYFVDDWSGNLYTIDPNTYQASVVKGLGDPYDGLIYVNAVPEPGTMMLLGTGIVGLAGRLRRKK